MSRPTSSTDTPWKLHVLPFSLEQYTHLHLSVMVRDGVFPSGKVMHVPAEPCAGR